MNWWSCMAKKETTNSEKMMKYSRRIEYTKRHLKCEKRETVRNTQLIVGWLMSKPCAHHVQKSYFNCNCNCSSTENSKWYSAQMVFPGLNRKSRQCLIWKFFKNAQHLRAPFLTHTLVSFVTEFEVSQFARIATHYCIYLSRFNCHLPTNQTQNKQHSDGII